MPLGAFKAALMGTAGVSTGDVVLLTTATADGSATYLDFTSKITSTYGEYIFKFYNIHPNVSNKYLAVNFSTDGGSNFDVVKTTTAFMASHTEADATAFAYQTGWDRAQEADRQRLSDGAGTDNDMSIAGELHLFNPASTTYVKHFYSRTSTYEQGDKSTDSFAAGYANSTSAINAVRFEMSANNMDAGTIKMWGVK